MARPSITDAVADLIGGLAQPGVYTELAVLAGCLLLAWAIARLLRGRVANPSSIWFGRHVVDGLLFPVLALALAFSANLALAGLVRPALFKLALPILLSLVVIRLAVRVMSASFPGSSVVGTVERSVSWLAWIAVVLWVTGALPLLLDAMEDVTWTVGGKPLSLRTLVEGTLTAGLVLVLTLWIAAEIERRLLRSSGANLSIRKMFANVVRALLLFIGLLIALSAIGIDLTALSVLGGAVGVGLGFGLQKIAANYISGFVVLAERSLRIGDMVKIDNFEGRITDIRTRYTVVRSLGGREAIVPNEMLITQRVENLSLADPQVLLTCEVQVAYGTDVRALAPLLEAAAAGVPRVLSDPGPGCQIASLGADGIDLKLQFWIRDSENGQGNVRSSVYLVMLELLAAQGVEIPYPQRVLRHIDVQAPAPKGGDA
ncbi:MAG: mechanosensitive ion channel domain-containing protein [Burkholderiaceae bacterium]